MSSHNNDHGYNHGHHGSSFAIILLILGIIALVAGLFMIGMNGLNHFSTTLLLGVAAICLLVYFFDGIKESVAGSRTIIKCILFLGGGIILTMGIIMTMRNSLVHSNSIVFVTIGAVSLIMWLIAMILWRDPNAPPLWGKHPHPKPWVPINYETPLEDNPREGHTHSKHS